MTEQERSRDIFNMEVEWRKDLCQNQYDYKIYAVIFGSLNFLCNNQMSNNSFLTTIFCFPSVKVTFKVFFSAKTNGKIVLFVSVPQKQFRINTFSCFKINYVNEATWI